MFKKVDLNIYIYFFNSFYEDRTLKQSSLQANNKIAFSYDCSAYKVYSSFQRTD